MEVLPKVSIIIPVYNTAPYLQECLDSIANQTLKEIEILCVDDGSTDGSLDILRSYSAQDPRIHIYQTVDSQGAGPARNLAMRHARGEYIAFMDADDLYPGLHVIELLYKTAEKNHAKICGGSLLRLWDGEDSKRLLRDCEADLFFTIDGACSYRDYQSSLGFYRFIFQRSMLIQNQIFFPPYLRCQDPPFFAKAMMAAESFYHISEATYVYRIGHKKIDWTDEKTYDLHRGVTEILDISSAAQYETLHVSAIKIIYRYIYAGAFDKIDKPKGLKLLQTLSEAVNISLVEKELNKEAYQNIVPYFNGKRVILYGTGVDGQILVPYLRQLPDISLLGVCTSGTTQRGIWSHEGIELPICSRQEWKQTAPEATILIATTGKYHEEIFKACQEMGFQEIIPAWQELMYAACAFRFKNSGNKFAF